MKRTGLFPGSFDPFTKGHEAVVRKALLIFDEVIIGIGVNSTKSYLFDLEKRKAHIRSLFPDDPRVRIETYSTLTVNFCEEVRADHIIRGLRDSKDFEYERSIAHMNHELSGIETIFFLTDTQYAAINATIVREIYRNGGNITAFVTNVEQLV
jgi:pantetheine-phosphate adenylyltransferase